MDYTTISKKAENFVTTLFEKNEQEALQFHNLEHTRNVMAKAEEIAAQYDLSEKDQAVLLYSSLRFTTRVTCSLNQRCMK